MKYPTEEQLTKMAKAGANFSRHCRNAWTGEQYCCCVRAEEVMYWPHLVAVTNFPGKPLVDYANGGGLHHFYLGRPDQHTWDEKRWREEITKKLQKREGSKD